MCKYYIGYTSNFDLRNASSSGGVGSAIIKYLLTHHRFGTAITFEFNKVKCQYEPHIIHNYDDYNNCGSIYQDISLYSFIKNNINEIKDGIVLTCMPCQVKPIKSLLDKNNIENFIISLCCSGQTTVEGTWYYYKLLKIKKESVSHIQYRGDGWPSGIKIVLDDGSTIKKKNYTYPWTLMHKSLLFRPKRCLYCTKKTSQDCDVSLADPWLKEYIENDKIGNSVVIISSTFGIETINNMLDDKELELKEINEETYIKSQLGTIEQKAKACEHRTFNKLLSYMGKDGSYYKKIATSSESFLKLHNRFVRILYKVF
ncbi:MAG: Coenzyme F420 hydrogenase/dehydrogenase, beta subunit C-terminal domain [Prevotella sp.]|nr:Coenzyme F420 hydrogenase/dehydrogenase, beta subunit C-terminal domain [Prevotella sp.]